MFDTVAVVEAARAGRLEASWTALETQRGYLMRRWGMFVVIGLALTSFSGAALSAGWQLLRAVGPLPMPQSLPQVIQFLQYLALSGLWIPALMMFAGVGMTIALIPYDALPFRSERLLLMPEGFIVTRGGGWRPIVSVAYDAASAITPENPRASDAAQGRYPLRITLFNGASRRWDPRGRFGPARETGARIISDYGRWRARQAGGGFAPPVAAPPVNAPAILAQARASAAPPEWEVWGRTGPRRRLPAPYGPGGYQPQDGAPTPAWLWMTFVGVPLACFAGAFAVTALCGAIPTLLALFANGGGPLGGSVFWLVFDGAFLLLAGGGIWWLRRVPGMLESARYWLAVLTPEAFIISLSAAPMPELVVPFAITSRIAYREWTVSSGESSTRQRALDIWRADGSFFTWEGIPQRRLGERVIQALQAYQARQGYLAHQAPGEALPSGAPQER